MEENKNKQGGRHASRQGSVRTILRRLCLVVLVFSLLGLAVYWARQWSAKRDYDRLQQQNQAASSAASSAASVQATPAPSAEPLDIPVDFAQLQAQNPDAYAWISIPGTLVDYPVMQTADETDYYLDHTFERGYGLPGSIYTRNDTAQDFSDPCTVVYGHNMKDDTMFGSLHEYEKADFFADAANRTIYTYSPNAIREWTIFAAVEYSDVLLTAAYDFADPLDMQAFLDSLRTSRGSYDREVSVTGSSRLIVLSTCVGGNRDTVRYLVVGVLTDERVQAMG